MFDFLIDIMPREEPDSGTGNWANGDGEDGGDGGGGDGGGGGSGGAESVAGGSEAVPGQSRSGSGSVDELGMNGEDGGVVGIGGDDALRDTEGGEFADEDLYNEFVQRDA